MQTNNHKIVDYDLVLDAKYGKKEVLKELDMKKRQKHSMPLSYFYKLAKKLKLHRVN